MRISFAHVIALVATAGSLSGCVAAVVPLVAGGAIAQSGLRKGGETDTAPVESLADVSPRPATAIAGAGDGAVIAAGSSYGPFIGHAFQFAAGHGPADDKASALLADPSSLEPSRTSCGTLPPAVLIDLDPAGSLMPLEDGEQPSDAGLGPSLERMRETGLAVVWISDRRPEAAGRIRDLLADAALDPYGTDPLMLMRFDGETKQMRRRGLGKAYCIIAIAGDQRADFDELYQYVLDPTLAAPLEEMIGNGWFLAPPPLG